MGHGGARRPVQKCVCLRASPVRPASGRRTPLGDGSLVPAAVAMAGTGPERARLLRTIRSRSSTEKPHGDQCVADGIPLARSRRRGHRENQRRDRGVGASRRWSGQDVKMGVNRVG